ncbi:hypothetical protein JW933_04205, partial [candidate division FCPU426 bacterium]|nr:hypothetical protein [candidate division FCPU426 bacterium]
MSTLLSPEERTTDRIEIVGYFSSGAAAVTLVVYFGMMFFYKPVQLHSLGTQALVLSCCLLVLITGFFIPREKNLARILFKFFFYFLAVLGYYQTVNQGQWYLGLAAAYSLYALWVLTHPLAVSRFRKLCLHEQRQLPAAVGLTWHRIILSLYALVTFVNGLLILSAEDVKQDIDQGMLKLFLALAIAFLLVFFRRLHNWARWCIILICLGLGFSGLPDTINPRIKNYLEYWQSLIFVFYFLGVSAYLAFSPLIRSVFISRPAKPKTSTASLP